MKDLKNLTWFEDLLQDANNELISQGLKQGRKCAAYICENTPEPLGDYFAGPNHVLPTNGTARFSSGLNVQSFVKRSTYLYYDSASLLSSADDVVRFARAEGLDAHANSIIQRQIRENNKK